MKEVVERVATLLYKLRMFGVPIDGSDNVLCDNDAVYNNTIILESVVKKKHHSIYYHRCSNAVDADTLSVSKQVNENDLSDLFTKIMTASRRRFLLENFTY